jgi:hypothetical protein
MSSVTKQRGTLTRLAVIHFLPLEKYPPAMNLLNMLAKERRLRIDVYTTHVGDSPEFKIANDQVRIYRFGSSGNSRRTTSNLVSYFQFYGGCLGRLALTGPRLVMYFDSISFLPAYYYKKYLNKACTLFAHYHEYMSPAEYLNGMKLVRLAHHREREMYSGMKWISHTNEERLKDFQKDEGITNSSALRVMPNYPPASWQVKANPEPQTPIRFVYVGALSLDTMFTRQVCEWMEQQAGAATFDIYSSNMTAEAREYLLDGHLQYTRYCGSVDYFHLPEILRQYNVGLILYTGHIPNYINNAPNKLFEYYVSGLDVWFPEHMVSSKLYSTNRTYPQVRAVNFNTLDGIRITDFVDRTNLTFEMNDYSLEKSTGNFLQEIEKLIDAA